jgi:putative pyruvate formate lyase activating enzyme
MRRCELCPRACRVDRAKGETGFCQSPPELVIASHHPHFGEEAPLVGTRGSGTIFFSHCSLRCVFCLNWDISMGGKGQRYRPEDLAQMMLELQATGCHNINLVTPTHYSPHIVQALDIAAAQGLRIPLVYNTCGWELPEVLRLLDGIVDIYLADFKYGSGEMAAIYSTDAPPGFVGEAAGRYTSSEVYTEITRAALREMHRQVGVAKPADDGLIHRGLMIRHLVMPNGVSGSEAVMRWIAANLPADTYVNIMSQYAPMYKARRMPPIARPITREEYRQVVETAVEAGLTNLDIQGYRRFLA